MTDPLALRAGAESLAAPLPALLAQADHLAASVILGDHGRRRAGTGDTFWQYRPAQSHDEARMIDWRRSARSDAAFVQEKEWQIAQTVMLWVDRSASMQFAAGDRPSKADRANLLALATAIVLLRGGERVGLTGQTVPARRGHAQSQILAQALLDGQTGDYGHPDTRGLLPHSRAMFVSDFLGDFDMIEAAMLQAADGGIKGALVQVLDPQEIDFPFDGRTIFESMQGSLRHETLKAGDLRAAYLSRLAQRQDRLAELARITGWQFHIHHTGQSAAQTLLRIYGALSRGTR